ncbi:MAG: SprB repeat-containing protein, partial [Bacteroidetes bacterium]|nr:SprB repeat-containing protein [Bacteroidota bacterium]
MKVLNIISSIVMLFLLVAFTAQQTQAQSAQVIVSWSTGHCNICGGPNGNYACAQGSGSPQWNAGVRSFVDPIPFGNVIVSVSVRVDKVNCGISSLGAKINAEAVQTVGINTGNCACGACFPTTLSRIHNYPTYNYGGANTVDLDNIGNLCVKQAVITFNYVTACPPNLALSLVTTDVSCNGGADGSATVSAGAGTAPFSFAWSNGANTATASGLVA